MTRVAAAVSTALAAALLLVVLLVLLFVLLFVGMAASAARPSVPARALRAYVAQVQKVRVPVDALLEGTEPILSAYRANQVSPAQASLEMNDVEERFAGYVVTMLEITPSNPTLARLNQPYARTYYLEDNYLSTLASDLDEGDFGNLPDTQNQQRLAIIVWRTQLQILAGRDHVRLPSDIEQAGRGEIAPSLSSS
jgi:hypothetical protein